MVFSSYMLIGKSQTLFDISYFWAFCGSIFALITPTVITYTGPVNMRYSMEQMCRLLNINILRGTMPLEQILTLMAYLNGDLADESDDLVDDTMLYFFFVSLAARARYIGGTQTWDDALIQATESYTEPVPGAREKLVKVLKVMLTIWCANALKAQAEAMMAQL